jgi:hypothetical protein
MHGKKENIKNCDEVFYRRPVDDESTEMDIIKWIMKKWTDLSCPRTRSCGELLLLLQLN